MIDCKLGIDGEILGNTPINADKVDSYGKSKLKAEQILTKCSNENQLKIKDINVF